MTRMIVTALSLFMLGAATCVRAHPLPDNWPEWIEYLLTQPAEALPEPSDRITQEPETRGDIVQEMEASENRVFQSNCARPVWGVQWCGVTMVAALEPGTRASWSIPQGVLAIGGGVSVYINQNTEYCYVDEEGSFCLATRGGGYIDYLAREAVLWSDGLSPATVTMGATVFCQERCPDLILNAR